jgi:hypothetical protein
MDKVQLALPIRPGVEGGLRAAAKPAMVDGSSIFLGLFGFWGTKAPVEQRKSWNCKQGGYRGAEMKAGVGCKGEAGEKVLLKRCPAEMTLSRAS